MENLLQNFLLWVARVAAIAGVVICLVAVGARLSGAFWIIGFQAGTLLQAGNAVLLLGCLSYLALLTRRK